MNGLLHPPLPLRKPREGMITLCPMRHAIFYVITHAPVGHPRTMKIPPRPPLRKWGINSSLWQREVGRDFKECYFLCKGHHARMIVPFPSVDSIAKEPPESSVRSLMLVSPNPFSRSLGQASSLGGSPGHCLEVPILFCLRFSSRTNGQDSHGCVWRCCSLPLE